MEILIYFRDLLEKAVRSHFLVNFVNSFYDWIVIIGGIALGLQLIFFSRWERNTISDLKDEGKDLLGVPGLASVFKSILSILSSLLFKLSFFRNGDYFEAGAIVFLAICAVILLGFTIWHLIDICKWWGDSLESARKLAWINLCCDLLVLVNIVSTFLTDAFPLP